MLTDLLGKIKSFLQANQKDLFLAAMVFLVSVASFGLGRLSVIWPGKEPIRIDEPAGAVETAGMVQDGFVKRSPASPADSDSPAPKTSSSQGNYVASKNGSSYHYPWCPSAGRIKEENKIWFQTKEEAHRAGYKPAGNCPGL